MMGQIPLAEVLTLAAQDKCKTGWVYTPNAAYFIRSDEHAPDTWFRVQRRMGGYEEVEEDFNEVYEMTLFGADVQHKWVHSEDNFGYHGMLSDDTHLSELQPLDSELLLWGEVDDDQPNDIRWTKLSSARTGAILVPIAETNGHCHVALRQRDYLSEDSYGNVFVAASRYLGLKPTPEIDVKKVLK